MFLGPLKEWSEEKMWKELFFPTRANRPGLHSEDAKLCPEMFEIFEQENLLRFITRQLSCAILLARLLYLFYTYSIQKKNMFAWEYK